MITDACTGYGASQNNGDWTPLAEFNNDKCWENGYPYWKRQYNGIFSTQIIQDDKDIYLYCIVHGENKNEKDLEEKVHINSIQPKKDYDTDDLIGP